MNLAQIENEVEQNQRRLESCDRHDFHPKDGKQTFMCRWVCSKCQGEVDSLARLWYDKGLNDGSHT